MNVPELVQFANSREHFADVEPRMFLLEDARIVKQCPKVASGDIFHREVYMLCILKGIQQTDQPGGFRRGEDVSLNEDVSDLGEPWSKAEEMTMEDGTRHTSSILNNVRLRIFFRAHTSPVSCLRARYTSPYPPCPT